MARFEKPISRVAATAVVCQKVGRSGIRPWMGLLPPFRGSSLLLIFDTAGSRPQLCAFTASRLPVSYQGDNWGTKFFRSGRVHPFSSACHPRKFFFKTRISTNGSRMAADSLVSVPPDIPGVVFSILSSFSSILSPSRHPKRLPHQSLKYPIPPTPPARSSFRRPTASLPIS